MPEWNKARVCFKSDSFVAVEKGLITDRSQIGVKLDKMTNDAPNWAAYVAVFIDLWS